jgi:hypothetical protein
MEVAGAVDQERKRMPVSLTPQEIVHRGAFGLRVQHLPRTGLTLLSSLLLHAPLLLLLLLTLLLLLLRCPLPVVVEAHSLARLSSIVPSSSNIHTYHSDSIQHEARQVRDVLQSDTQLLDQASVSYRS